MKKTSDVVLVLGAQSDFQPRRGKENHFLNFPHFPIFFLIFPKLFFIFPEFEQLVHTREDPGYDTACAACTLVYMKFKDHSQIKIPSTFSFKVWSTRCLKYHNAGPLLLCGTPLAINCDDLLSYEPNIRRDSKLCVSCFCFLRGRAFIKIKSEEIILSKRFSNNYNLLFIGDTCGFNRLDYMYCVNELQSRLVHSILGSFNHVFSQHIFQVLCFSFCLGNVTHVYSKIGHCPHFSPMYGRALSLCYILIWVKQQTKLILPDFYKFLHGLLRKPVE